MRCRFMPRTIGNSLVVLIDSVLKWFSALACIWRKETAVLSNIIYIVLVIVLIGNYLQITDLKKKSKKERETETFGGHWLS